MSWKVTGVASARRIDCSEVEPLVALMRLPSKNALGLQFPRSRLPFDDEKVTSYEIGAKNAFLDDKLFLNLAYFYNDYKDIQLSVFTSFDSNGDGVNDAFFGDFTNAGAGTVQGIELEYAWQMSEFFSLQGNMAWLDAEYDEFLTESANGTVNNIADQQKFTNAPEYWARSARCMHARWPAAAGSPGAPPGRTRARSIRPPIFPKPSSRTVTACSRPA